MKKRKQERRKSSLCQELEIIIELLKLRLKFNIESLAEAGKGRARGTPF